MGRSTDFRWRKSLKESEGLLYSRSIVGRALTARKDATRPVPSACRTNRLAGESAPPAVLDGHAVVIHRDGEAQSAKPPRNLGSYADGPKLQWSERCHSSASPEVGASVVLAMPSRDAPECALLMTVAISPSTGD